MKILCIGDIHIKLDNISQIDLAETQICKYLEIQPVSSPVDLIVVLGDVLHTHERLHVLALNRAYHFFEKLLKYAPLYIIVGNHDYIQNDQFLTTNHWMNALKEWTNLTIVDKVIHDSEHSLVFCPYVPNGRFAEALNTIGETIWKSARYIFAHQEFEGAEMRNGITSIYGDTWDTAYPKVISGHIHGKQTLPCGVHYAGALVGPSASLSLLDNDNLIEVPLFYPKKQVLSGLSVKDLESSSCPPNIQQIQIQDDYDTFINFKGGSLYKSLIARGIKINFKPILTHENPALNADHKINCFEKILYDTILARGDEYLYSALENIYKGQDIHEESILIVPTQ